MEVNVNVWKRIAVQKCVCVCVCSRASSFTPNSLRKLLETEEYSLISLQPYLLLNQAPLIQHRWWNVLIYCKMWRFQHERKTLRKSQPNTLFSLLWGTQKAAGEEFPEECMLEVPLCSLLVFPYTINRKRSEKKSKAYGDSAATLQPFERKTGDRGAGEKEAWRPQRQLCACERACVPWILTSSVVSTIFSTEEK